MLISCSKSRDAVEVRLAKVQQGLDRSAAALATLESLSSEGYRAWGLEAKGDIHVARGELELAHAADELGTRSNARLLSEHGTDERIAPEGRP